MSRVLFVSLDEGEVVSRCLAAKVGISALEGLPAGGTRLVCMSVDGAETMRKKLKTNLLTGVVVRHARRPATPLW
jgi:hypothetical protein